MSTRPGLVQCAAGQDVNKPTSRPRSSPHDKHVSSGDHIRHQSEDVLSTLPSVHGASPPRFHSRMRKRESFLRAMTNAASSVRVPTLHLTMSSKQDQPLPPARSQSATSTSLRRKNEHLSRLRHSVFSTSRRKGAVQAREQAREAIFELPSEVDPKVALLPRERFDSGAECETRLCSMDSTSADIWPDCRYLKKMSISTPFNFEHVTHTDRQQLPPLHTLHEHDLPGRVRALSAHQRPKRQLDGIRADDLSEKLPAMGLVRGSPSSRPSSPMPSQLPGQADPTAMHSRTISSAATQISCSLPRRDNVPVRKSSLAVLNDQRLNYLSQLVGPEASVPDPSAADDCQDTQHPQLDDGVPAAPTRQVSTSDRSKLPLPAVPDVPPLRMLGDAAVASASSLCETASSTCSQSERWSQRSSGLRSPATSDLSRPSHIKSESIFSDATWEDDVEFCYRHEAESTCDFDWKVDEPVRSTSRSAPSHGNVTPAPTTPSPLAQSERPDGSVSGVATCNAGPQRLPHRKTSVGHRGFLAARTDSVLGRQKSLAPKRVEVVSKSSKVSLLSPVYSIAGCDGSPESPLTPSKGHFRDFDRTQRISIESLSDPESRKTSISQSRTSDAGSTRNAVRPAVDGTPRWSSASSTCTPELLPSSRRGTTASDRSTATMDSAATRRTILANLRLLAPQSIHPAFRNEPVREAVALTRSASSLDIRSPVDSRYEPSRQRSCFSLAENRAGLPNDTNEGAWM